MDARTKKLLRDVVDAGQSILARCGGHIDCARRQGANSWEVGAALSLSRLWRGQGKRDDARTLLAEIYGWFTDTSAGPVLRSPAEGGGLRSAGGFETRDLRAAKVLLDEPSQGR